jgi:hypothetical protein
MKAMFKRPWMVLSIVIWATMLACVTINIYFPAEKVESVAGEIVQDIRGPYPGEGEKTNPENQGSFLRRMLFAFDPASAWAEDVTTVSNPTIRATKKRMKERYAFMRPYYRKGMLEEEDDGYVSLKNTSSLDLKALRDLKSLVSAENKDRKILYLEVARALKINPDQIDRIGSIFAKEWRKFAP